MESCVKSIIKSAPEKAGEFSEILGKGLMAGFIGTGFMTLSQFIEMKITKREGSQIPVKALEKVTEVEIKEEDNQRLNYAIHVLYGTGWGKARAFIASLGLKKWQSTLLHFGMVYTTALVALPALRLTPPVKEWGLKAISIDILHHLIYVTSVGIAFDAMDEARHKKSPNLLVRALKFF